MTFRFCCCLLLLVVAPLSAQNSLFHKALLLDTLYDHLEEENATPRRFFQELRDLYPGEVTDADVRTDFTDNPFLAQRVGNVFNLLSLSEGEDRDQTTELREERARLLSVIGRQAANYCANLVKRGETCPFAEEIKQLNKGDVSEILPVIREGILNKVLRRELMETERALYAIDRQLLELTLATEKNLLLSAAVGTGLPFSGGEGGQAFTSIVLPASTSGQSLQASLIDGASRWIAERMREELSIAFFDRFEDWIGDQNVYVLFPNTFAALGASVTTDYSLIIEVLRQAFERDLQELPFQAIEFLALELEATPRQLAAEEAMATALRDINAADAAIRRNTKALKDGQETLERYKADEEAGSIISDEKIAVLTSRFEKMLGDVKINLDARRSATEALARAETSAAQNQRILNYLRFSVEAIRELGAGRHPSSLLSTLNERVEEIFPQSGDLKTAVLILDVISRSMLDVDAENNTVWLKRDKLLQIGRDRQLRDFFFGLVYQELKQTLRRKQAQLQNESKTLLEEKLLLTGYADSLNRRQTGIREDLFMSLFYNEDVILDYVVSDAAQTEEAIEDYLTGLATADRDLFELEDTIAIPAGLRALYDKIKASPGLASYDPAEEQQLEDAAEAAFGEFEENMRAIYERYGLPDVEGDVGHSQYSLGVIEGIFDTSYFVHQPFREQIMEAAAGWFDEGVANDAARAEIYEAFKPVVDAKVEEATYAAPFHLIMDSLRRQIGVELNEQILIPDSVALVTEFELTDSELPLLGLRLNNLEKEQAFIDRLLLEDRNTFGQLINEFSQFTERIDFIQHEFAELRERDKANLGTPEFVYLLQNSLGVVKQLFRVALPGEEGALDTIQQLTDNVLEAYSAVLTEEYDAVVMNVVPIALSLTRLNYANRLRELDRGSAAYEQLLAERAEKERRLREVFRYGAFLAAVVQSQNPEEIKEAIRAVALPTGSYSIKRRSFGNVSLNAYPGITGGAEVLNGNGEAVWAPNFGFTAPIGMAFSWGYRGKIDPVLYDVRESYRQRVDKSPFMRDNRFLTGHSGSLFFPLIDLGAIVLFRLDGSTETLPEDVGFQQIFSPGVVYTHGFPKLPLSLSLGTQMSPQLRKFGEERANALRFNVSLTVDLPMANFHTRSEEK